MILSETKSKIFSMKSKRIDSNPDFMTIAALQFDLQNDPDLYRLFAMILLATKK